MSHSHEYDSIPAPLPPLLPPLHPPSPQHQRHGSHNSFTSNPNHDTPASSVSQDQLPDSHVPTPNHVATAGRKRKASGPGSRGVANLTPEQLAKKRANDREAQRAIRERTKSTIEGLEKRIRDLESQKPFQDLQNALRERDRVLDENETLRKRLAAVASLVGSAFHPGMNELAASAVQQASNFRPSHDTTLPRPELHSPLSTTAPTPASGGTLRRWSPSLEQPLESQFSPMTTSTSTPYGASLHSSPAAQRNESERHDVNYIIDTSRPQTATPQSTETTRTPLYKRLPNNSSPTCPLDHLLNDFVQARRKLLRSGTPMADVLGPENPSFDHLIDDHPSATDTRHPSSALLIDTLSKFPDIKAIPEQAAILYLMFMFMRWIICPCQPCYERLPEWIRPTTEQLETPHAIWVDNVCWPTMRDKLIRATGTAAEVQLESFFIPFTTTVTVNWPYGDDHVLEHSATSGAPQAARLSSAFESHIRQLSNWSLGASFVNTYPGLIDESVTVVDRRV